VPDREPLSGDKEHALIRTATVLVIACPHALGLAIPLVIAISTSLGAQNGLLVKDRLALERAPNLDVVIFDKTGILTRGSPAVSGVAAAARAIKSSSVVPSAAVESNSEHPLAKAIVAAAWRRGLNRLAATNFEALPGRGAKALVEGTSVQIGGPRLVSEAMVTVPPEVEKLTTAWTSDGKTVLYALAQGRLLGFPEPITAASRKAVPSASAIARRATTFLYSGFYGSNKRANELAFNLGSDRVGVDSGRGEKLPGVVDAVHASWFDIDRVEARLGKLCDVVVILQRSCNATYPQLHVAPNLLRHIPANHNI
jgi:Cu2+-exporting ATPase